MKRQLAESRALVVSLVVAGLLSPFAVAQLLLPDPETGKLVVSDFGERVGIDTADYPRALAREVTSPDRLSLGDRTIAIGHHEASIVRKLGSNPIVVEAPSLFSGESASALCLRLLKEHPSTIHRYDLMGFRDRVREQWVKGYRWELPDIGEIVVYFAAAQKTGPFVAELIRLRLEPAQEESVFFESRTIVVRGGIPSVSWDIAKDSIRIE